MECIFSHNFFKFFFEIIHVFSGMKPEPFNEFFIFFFTVLLVADAMFFSSQIPAQKTMFTILAVVKKVRMLAISAIHAPETFVTIETIGTAIAQLAVKSEYEIETFVRSDVSVSIKQFFTFFHTYSKVAIL